MSAENPKIIEILARAVRAPLVRPIVTATTTIPDAPLILIDVKTDVDVTGHAYLFGYTPVTLHPMLALIRELGPLLVGKPITPAVRLREFGQQFRLLGKQGLMGMVISGLDMAFWDALGKSVNRPVAALLGADTSFLPAYDSYGVVDPARDAKDMEASLEAGFRAIKIKIGVGTVQQDIETIVGVRKVIGESVRLMVDYNQSLTVPDAIHRVKALADHGVYWVEEPVHAEDLAGHATVRAATSVPIQTGENWWFPEDMARAVQARACDFAMIDIMKIGGISGWMGAAGQAEGASLPVSSHLFIEASAHALAATPTAQFVEHLDVAAAVLANPVTVVQGRIAPRGPGLGIEWNETAIKRYEV